MNAKLLFAATVALAITSSLSSFAQAADATAPLSRADVKAEVQRAIASGSLPVTEYSLSFGARDAALSSTTTRSQVLADLQAAQRTAGYRAVLASDYNVYPTEQNRATSVTRAQVKAEVAQAMADGTLPVSDYAGDDQIIRTHAKAPAANRASATLAQRLKAALSRDAS